MSHSMAPHEVNCSPNRFAELSTGVNKTHRLARNKHDSICSTIIILLGLVRPFAVFWTIISIVIDSIQAATRWFSSHVFQKAVKIRPSLTDLYSSSSIILVSAFFRVFAPSMHVIPDPINGENFSGFSASRISEAPATFAAPGGYGLKSCFALRPAVAPAFYKSLFIGKIQYGQLSELLPDAIFNSSVGHRNLSNKYYFLCQV